MTVQDELRQELNEIDASLATLYQQRDEFRQQRDAPDALPDTSDDAVLIREFEDEQQVIEQLEARRRALLEQLG
jgi:hypothetical protein